MLRGCCMKDNYNELAKLFDNTPRICENCGGGFDYNGAGEYVCKKCGRIEYDDYGKVRKFVEENGPAPYHVVKKATGVEGRLVREYLDTPSSVRKFDMICQGCGCKIAAGKYCASCAASKASKPSITKSDPSLGSKKFTKIEKKGGIHFVVDRNEKK